MPERSSTPKMAGPALGKAGFSLVEVMVTLVILSVGLVGLSQLQWGSSRASTESVQRGMVQVQALDMGERIWLDLRDPLGEVAAWQAAHSGSLPGWSGEVEEDPSDSDLIRIRIEWQGSSASGIRPRFDHFVRIPQVAP